MKSLSLALNVVLVIAVAILYYLHFKKEEPVDVQHTSISASFPAGGIYYVNSDSLLDEYDYYKNKKKEFEATQDRIKTELRMEGEKLQREVETYQQQAIGMTDMERAKKEETLAMKQQQLMQRKDELLEKLDMEQNKSSEELFSRLNNYLRNDKNKNYNFVLGFQKGGGILYANDSLNITREVVEGLNREFNKPVE